MFVARYSDPFPAKTRLSTNEKSVATRARRVGRGARCFDLLVRGDR